MSALRDFLAATRDLAAGVVHTARAVSDSHHLAPIHALIRQGADEIAQVLPAFPESNVRPQAELGQLFEITPGMATEQIKGHQPDLDLDR